MVLLLTMPDSAKGCATVVGNTGCDFVWMCELCMDKLSFLFDMSRVGIDGCKSYNGMIRMTRDDSVSSKLFRIPCFCCND